MIKGVELLGRQVKPIVKKTFYTDPDRLTGGAHYYLPPEKSAAMCTAAANEEKARIRKENREQKWIVWGVFFDGTFNLLSELGYEQNNLVRSDFRLIKEK